jgi:hypothetical protein
MIKSMFCRECGCEILSELDLGYSDTEIEMRSIFPGHPQKERIVKCFHICAARKDDDDHWWDEFKKTPEYKYKCAFMWFCRQFDDDAYFREATE